MMFTWGLSRITGSAAKSLGASEDTANFIALGTTVLLCPLDPVGAAIGASHAIARMGSKDNEFAKAADGVLSVAAVFVAVGDVSGVSDVASCCSNTNA